MVNNYVIIKNETPDYYSFCLKYNFFIFKDVFHRGEVGPYGEVKINQREILSNVYIRYGRAQGERCIKEPMLQRDYNAIDNPTFYIRPSGKKVLLVCNRGGTQPECGNLGRPPPACTCRNVNAKQKLEEKWSKEGGTNMQATDQDFIDVTTPLGPDDLRKLFDVLGIQSHVVEKTEVGTGTKDVDLNARAILRKWRQEKASAATRGVILNALGKCTCKK